MSPESSPSPEFNEDERAIVVIKAYIEGNATREDLLEATRDIEKAHKPGLMNKARGDEKLDGRKLTLYQQASQIIMLPPEDHHLFLPVEKDSLI